MFKFDCIFYLQKVPCFIFTWVILVFVVLINKKYNCSSVIQNWAKSNYFHNRSLHLLLFVVIFESCFEILLNCIIFKRPVSIFIIGTPVLGGRNFSQDQRLMSNENALESVRSEIRFKMHSTLRWTNRRVRGVRFVRVRHLRCDLILDKATYGLRTFSHLCWPNNNLTPRRRVAPLRTLHLGICSPFRFAALLIRGRLRAPIPLGKFNSIRN